MEVTKSGSWLNERCLVIRASRTEDGHIIDKWYNQIINHMEELNLIKEASE